jgi:hypothetical protein
MDIFLNLKSAKALGISVPLPLSGRADGLSSSQAIGENAFETTSRCFFLNNLSRPLHIRNGLIADLKSMGRLTAGLCHFRTHAVQQKAFTR